MPHYHPEQLIFSRAKFNSIVKKNYRNNFINRMNKIEFFGKWRSRMWWKKNKARLSVSLVKNRYSLLVISFVRLFQSHAKLLLIVAVTVVGPCQWIINRYTYSLSRVSCTAIDCPGRVLYSFSPRIPFASSPFFFIFPHLSIPLYLPFNIPTVFYYSLSAVLRSKSRESRVLNVSYLSYVCGLTQELFFFFSNEILDLILSDA